MSAPKDKANAAFSLEDDLAAAEVAAPLPASLRAPTLASADSAGAPGGGEQLSPLAAGGPREAEVQPAEEQAVPTYPSGAQQPRPLQQSLEALKLGSMRLAGAIKRTAVAVKPAALSAIGTGGGAAAAAAAPAPAAGDDEAPANGGSPTAGGGVAAISKLRATATGLGAIARDTSNRLFQSASEGLKWVATPDPLLSICRSEPSVPQLVLACCTALLAGEGARTEGVFRAAAPAEEVDRVSTCLAGGRPTVLLPPGTSPHRRRQPVPSKSAALLQQLPPVNSNVLRVLLEVCHYCNHNAAATEMDALALAQSLAPCVAWLPPPTRAHRVAPPSGGEQQQQEQQQEEQQQQQDAAAAGASEADHRVVHLEGEEAQAIVHVLEGLISRFPIIFG
ncbi:hypothetical protein Rsub_00521 [Raphidocelis subcapitata]|uniref:Rho-GAP domain-containing protein n=1 Tax=Raphidocelis subcapitata TaxID=307507 RepID=A0A2V0NQI9_9CHLO|nr:hypothetical protein Rsub_00521 [Raphidocelis subcapitata]|eukprot:GBF87810.1 hypothetical protein Rsub_00521 [Raphidocelis subcapitata]